MPAGPRAHHSWGRSRIIKLYTSLRKAGAEHVLGHQMLRSGTSVGAQYREACRARSPAEFVSKMESALQELDETSYWFELLVESEIVRASRLGPLIDETEQLTAVFVASIVTAKRKRK
jgi:four helix bundle protein